jgi:hypothetical protein
MAMADLVIRYTNGVRTLHIDHSDKRNTMECVLHDKSRERRIPLPPELATLSLSQIEKAMEVLWHDEGETEARDRGRAKSDGDQQRLLPVGDGH